MPIFFGEAVSSDFGAGDSEEREDVDGEIESSEPLSEPLELAFATLVVEVDDVEDFEASDEAFDDDESDEDVDVEGFFSVLIKVALQSEFVTLSIGV